MSVPGPGRTVTLAATPVLRPMTPPAFADLLTGVLLTLPPDRLNGC